MRTMEPLMFRAVSGDKGEVSPGWRLLIVFFSTDHSKVVPLLQFYFIRASVVSYAVDSGYLFAYLESNKRLSRSENLVPVLTWNLTTGNKIL